ncbi:hypothetical protein [Dyadobacter luticola]|uniref:Peptidase MA-like domain-containing protein n=1 Tax=Dyadobacter luticola TaxID=1979387 RepID=A0A5R9KRG5_9BACT|nr:hypothetical protein [Dyadobacter luticola]TLU98881.1 hypothetical protein FEN17_20025 [Dyadobacter luticola]
MKNHNPVKNSFSRFGKYLLIGFFVLLASVFILYPQIVYCELIRFSSFQSSSNKIFYSPSIQPKHYKTLQTLISKSEARIDSFYSGKKSQPTIIICSNPQEYQRYCSSTEGAGCSLGTPWGQSFVILDAQSIDVDVISHEMSHTELLARLGWWKITTQMPQWFNEGLALMLDRRFVNNPDPAGRYLDYMDEWQYYTGGGQEILELKDITSIKGFFSGSQKYVMLAYMSSGMEVSYWLALSEEKGVASLIKNMNAGKKFKEAYKQAEQKQAISYYRKLPSNPLRILVREGVAE